MTNLPLPSIAQWLQTTLERRKITVQSLSRAIGRPRLDVLRWLSGREPIPRAVLGDIVSEIGDVDDIDHVLALKSAEEYRDDLYRVLNELAEWASYPIQGIAGAAFDLVDYLASEDAGATERSYVDAVTHCLIDAGYVFRQWARAAICGDFGAILTPDTIHRHLRYPANHFLGLALTLGEQDGNSQLDSCRLAGLAALRAAAQADPTDGPSELIRHHALHILGRYGPPAEQATVLDVVTGGRSSRGGLCARLGYVGLILSSGDDETQHTYLSLLRQDTRLARADLHFDAVHYGDARLSPRKRLPDSVERFERSADNLLRHLEQPHQYAPIAELDSLRLLSVLDHAGPTFFNRPDTGLRLRRIFESSPPPPPNSYRRKLEVRLFGLLRHARSQVIETPLVTVDDGAYDVFVAYHSADVATVRTVVDALRAVGVRPWFDLDDLPPGTLFQAQIEQALSGCRSVALMIGPSGIGPWEKLEVRAVISQFVARGMPVIPVLLDDPQGEPEIPLFLREFRMVQLSNPTEVHDLLWGITGRRPELGGQPPHATATAG